MCRRMMNTDPEAKTYKQKKSGRGQNPVKLQRCQFVIY